MTKLIRSGILFLLTACMSVYSRDTINISGTIKSATGIPIASAKICHTSDSTRCWLSRMNGSFSGWLIDSSGNVGIKQKTSNAPFANGGITINIPIEGEYSVVTRKLNGQIVFSKKIHLRPGYQTLSYLNRNNESSVYAISISGEGNLILAKSVFGVTASYSQSIRNAAFRSASAISASIKISSSGYSDVIQQIPNDSASRSAIAITLQNDPFGVTYSPTPGVFKGEINVAMSTQLTAGVIRYTLDGSIPTNLSEGYSLPVKIATDTFIRSQVFKNGVAQGGIFDGFWMKSANITPGNGKYTGYIHVSIDSLIGDERYTLDGSIPTMSSPLWPGKIGFDLDQDAFLVVRSFHGRRIPEAREYIIDDSSLAPRGRDSVYADTMLVKLSSLWNGAEIHYTRDGTTPTKASPTYSAPFSIWVSDTIKAIAYLTGRHSTVSEFKFFKISPSAPIFDTSLKGGFSDSVRVSIFSFPRNAVIRYTIDGSDPTQNGTYYKAPFFLNKSATVRAVAGTRNVSSISTRVYTQDGTPKIVPDSGLQVDSQSIHVTMSSLNNAVIRYTTDGSEPLETSKGYSAPLELTSFPVTVKSKAFWTGAAPSSTNTVIFTKSASGISANRVFDSKFFVPDSGFSGSLSKSIGNTCSQWPASSPFTIEYWINPNSIEFASGISSYQDVRETRGLNSNNLTTGDDRYKHIYASAWSWLNPNINHLSSDSVPFLNTWSHLAFVFTGSEGKLFLNGKTLNSVTGNPGSPVACGDNVVLNLNATGAAIDHIRISNLARYSVDFSPMASQSTAIDSNTVHLIRGSGFGLFDQVTHQVFVP